MSRLLRRANLRYLTQTRGSQFTSETFTGFLKQRGIQISMDGKGSYRDNLFVERLWRSVKYEEVYLKAYADGRDARAGIGEYLSFYKTQRPSVPESAQLLLPADSSLPRLGLGGSSTAPRTQMRVAIT